MRSFSNTYNSGKAKVDFTFEGKALLGLSILAIVTGVFLDDELLIFLSCLVFTFVFALKVSLPNPDILFQVVSYCPDYFQAGGATTHRLSLTAEFKGSNLPFIVIKAKHKAHKFQNIRSSQKKLSTLKSSQTYDIELIIEPKHQGLIEFEGLLVESKATFGLFNWEHFISIDLTRPVHPRCIQLNQISRLKQLWGESELREKEVSTLNQGDYLGYPRAYQPGDPLSAINWKRMAQNSIEPIVHHPIASDSQKMMIILDTALTLRKKGAQAKMNHLCEFARALAMQVEQEGLELEMILCSKESYQFALNSKSSWIDLLNMMATIKVSKTSSAQQEIEQQLNKTTLKICHLKIEHQPVGIQHSQANQIIKLDYDQMKNFMVQERNRHQHEADL